jgi:hypothetical protein
MNKSEKILRGTLCMCLVALSLTSCLKDDTADLIAKHDQAFEAMKYTYGITESDLIGDRIYVHYTYKTDTTEVAPVKPVYNNYIVMDVEGYNSDGNLFDVTDSAVAEKAGVFRDDLVYGPIMVNINNTFIGFYKAIQKLPEGWSANMLFPYDQAFGGYEPIAYKVKLYRVISDIDAYSETTFQQYKDLLGLTAADKLPGYDSVYSKIITPTNDSVDIYAGEKISIEIHGYYVETDTAYVHGFPGRCFFPLTDTSYTVDYYKGNTYFPVAPIVDDVVSLMHIGEERVVLSTAEYGYGDEGFVHPYTGTFIIPPSMALHYFIKLLSVSNK